MNYIIKTPIIETYRKVRDALEKREKFFPDSERNIVSTFEKYKEHCSIWIESYMIDFVRTQGYYDYPKCLPNNITGQPEPNNQNLKILHIDKFYDELPFINGKLRRMAFEHMDRYPEFQLTSFDCNGYLFESMDGKKLRFNKEGIGCEIRIMNQDCDGLRLRISKFSTEPDESYIEGFWDTGRRYGYVSQSNYLINDLEGVKNIIKHSASIFNDREVPIGDIIKDWKI